MKTQHSGNQEIKDRLSRIEGQVRGIHRMVDQGRPCEDIFTQLLAARAAMDKVATQIVGEHLDGCMGAMPPDEAKMAVQEAVKLLGKLS